MKQNRLNLFLAAMVSSLLICQNANATFFKIEQFVGYNTGNLGQDAQTGGLNGWNNSTPNVTLTNGSGSLDGTTLGLVASDGDRAFINNVVNLSARVTFPVSTFNPTVAPGLTNYYSFLYKFKNPADLTNAAGQII